MKGTCSIGFDRTRNLQHQDPQQTGITCAIYHVIMASLVHSTVTPLKNKVNFDAAHGVDMALIRSGQVRGVEMLQRRERYIHDYACVCRAVYSTRGDAAKGDMCPPPKCNFAVDQSDLKLLTAHASNF